MFSDTTARALALLNDPSATLADLSELIRRDGIVATAVLRLANSAAYRGHSLIETVPQATSRLGMSKCRQVLVAVGVRDAFRAPTAAVADACDALHRHALFTGTLATHLNALSGLGFRGDEFTAGLLHDIGRVVLCARAPAAFARIDPMTFIEDAGTPTLERAAVGTDHCELGLEFARANSLPQPIADAIRHHHNPKAAGGNGLLVALTAAADELANHVQRHRKLSNFLAERGPGFALLRSLGEAGAIRDVRKAVKPAVMTALRETRLMLRLTDR